MVVYRTTGSEHVFICIVNEHKYPNIARPRESEDYYVTMRTYPKTQDLFKIASSTIREMLYEAGTKKGFGGYVKVIDGGTHLAKSIMYTSGTKMRLKQAIEEVYKNFPDEYAVKPKSEPTYKSEPSYKKEKSYTNVDSESIKFKAITITNESGKVFLFLFVDDQQFALSDKTLAKLGGKEFIQLLFGKKCEGMCELEFESSTATKRQNAFVKYVRETLDAAPDAFKSKLDKYINIAKN